MIEFVLTWIVTSAARGARFLGRVARGLKRRFLQLIEWRVAGAIAGKTGRQFTLDYGPEFRTNCETYLSDLRGRENLRALEIGSAEGQSALWLLENFLTHPTASLTCIDPFYGPGHESRFDHNMNLSGYAGKVRKMKGRSESVLPGLEGETFDLIYIDGDHRACAVLLDAMFGWRLLKTGGVLILDDYQWQPHRRPEERPRLAVDIFLEILRDRMSVVHKGYQVIIRKTRENPKLKTQNAK